MTLITADEVDQLDKFFFQLIHGDFSAENADDLSMALRVEATVGKLRSIAGIHDETLNQKWLKHLSGK